MRTALLSTAAAAALAVLPITSRAAAPSNPPQTLQVAVTERGAEPAQITLKAGQPVNLVVTRKTDRTCAYQINLKEFGILKDLPLNQPVTLSFTPTRSGPIRYTCGMGMQLGTLLVQ